MYLSIYLWIDAVITKLIMVFVERRYKIDTSRLFHCKNNCLNCVIEYFLSSRSQWNVLRNCRKVKIFYISTKLL